MAKDCRTIWDNCLETIKKEIGEQNYQTWFSPIIPYKYADDTLTLSLPNQLFYEWIEGNYVALLQKVIRKELGEKGRLTYRINNTKDVPPKITQPPPSASPFQESLYLNPLFTFENFIIGDANKLAQATALAVASNPSTSFSPFLICSEVGLGKTHLAQAIIAHVKKNDPNINACYITSEIFTSQYIQKARENKLSSLMDLYKAFDIFVIDDIQFLGKKEKTQEAFFHIFKHLHRRGKRIVMTSDKPPSKLQDFEKGLLSCLKSGVFAEIHQLSLETIVTIIQSKLQQKNFHLSSEIINHIATQEIPNVREIEGVLASIIAYFNFTQKNVDKDIVQGIINNIVSQYKPKKELNIQYLHKIVADHFQISLETIKKKSRKKEIVLPRQLIMYLARKYTQQPLKAIGTTFGHKDHSTVSYACTNIKNLMNADKQLRSKIENIEKNIRKDFPQLS